MYIYQNDKLYTQIDGNKIVGVNIGSHGIEKVKGTETDVLESAMFLTPFEVQCKFNTQYGGTYEFPQEKKIVKPEGDETNVPINKPKVTTPKRGTKSTK